MLRVLRHPVFSRLFGAQVIALLGTGLLTVALGLLAYDLAGERAGAVLGTAYAIKMVAYVGLSPLAHALVGRLPRRQVLIAADLVRAGVALFLPFITEVWQIYVLIFVLQSASATFTPAFQAVIPDILPDEKDYTNALSMSRLALDLENIISPVMAGLLLMVMSYHGLFGGTVIGFLGSAILVYSTGISVTNRVERSSFSERLTRGARIYLATPRLRGLLALNFAAAAISAFVLVNTVVIVRAGYGRDEADLAYALAAYGGGSMVAAFGLPWLLDLMPERRIMVVSAAILSVLTVVQGLYFWKFGLLGWEGFLAVWGLSGLLYSAVLTPSGRLLRHSAHAHDRPTIFAAHFALSHACWLVTYPIAGWVGAVYGMAAAMILLGVLALLAVVIAGIIWPVESEQELSHSHLDLPSDHPHLHGLDPGKRHSHVLIIDDEHRSWPTQG